MNDEFLMYCGLFAFSLLGILIFTGIKSRIQERKNNKKNG